MRRLFASVTPRGGGNSAEPGREELVEGLRLGETGQPELAERPAVHPPHAVDRLLGEKHLAPVGGRRDPCRLVNVEADVAVAADQSLARVDAHARAYVLAARPGRSQMHPLRAHREACRGVRILEGEEEAVAPAIDLLAARRSRRRADELPV
jgi:hypothetical protein